MHSPQNKEELFNLRHAQARNVIERIFGVLKKRFRILLIGPEYDITIQAQIPAALWGWCIALSQAIFRASQICVRLVSTWVG